MCDFFNENSSSQSTSSDSERNYLNAGLTILQVEVNKSALNLCPPSSEESSSSSQSFSLREIELKICPDIDDVPLRNDDGEEGEHGPRREETIGDDTGGKSEGSSDEATGLEYTLAIIKPEALIYRKEIERLMIEEGFTVCQTRWLQLTPEQVSDFYHDNYEQESFARRVSSMSSAPILVYVISKSDAIEDWKKLIGPENIADARVYAPDSIRGKFGRVDNEMRNLVHGSADKYSAEREIKFFFPDRKVEPMPKEEAAIKYLWSEVNEALTEALVKCCEEKPGDPIAWLGNWLLDYKTNVPKYLCMHE